MRFLILLFLTLHLASNSLANSNCKSYLKSANTHQDFKLNPKFPYHSYRQVKDNIFALSRSNPSLLQVTTLNKTAEGNDIIVARLSNLPSNNNAPGVLFIGGLHAREHVSVEVPYRLLQYLVQEYNKSNPRIVSLLNSTEIFIIPIANPDGKNFDFANPGQTYWRKNRSLNQDKSFGVDLNRNFDFMWGKNKKDSTHELYQGPFPFSEKETLAIKNFIEMHLNIKALISYHSFGELILWPWGHQKEPISNNQDLKIFERLGKKMAKWNGYQSMQSNKMYTTSGGLGDWAYANHNIFAFTFELGPKNQADGGFYPNAKAINTIFNKNLEPALYLIEMASDPYKALNE